MKLQPLGQGANGGISWNFSVQSFDLSNPKFESKDFDLLIVFFQIGLITITRLISSILDPKDLQILDFASLLQGGSLQFPESAQDLPRLCGGTIQHAGCRGAVVGDSIS